MISVAKLRLAALSVAAAVMGLLIAYVTLNSQKQSADLRAKLDEVESQSYGMAEHFKDVLRDGSDRLARYRATGDEAAWNDVLKANTELGNWIQSQVAGPLTPRERDLLREMGTNYADYLQNVAEVRQKIVTTGPEGNPVPEKLSQTRRQMFDLGQELSQAHLDLRKKYFLEAREIVWRLNLTILVALLLLFLSVIGLAVFAYRDMIMPLRSKLVETQAMVDQREKLASLGLLAAGVAHEIRNPLTAIKAALFTQQKRFQPGSSEHDDVKVVEREIVRLERIVNDFLQFARPAEPELVVIAADQLLLETKLFFGPQLERHRIQLTLEPSVPMHIKVDPAQMKQVLINLVQNAADSITQGGTITLRARHDRKNLPQGETDVVILEVADTGDGIPPEVERRLFDPLFTTKETGTGLGLPIAARIVEKHGGALQYQTQVHHGTTFGIVLPQATP